MNYLLSDYDVRTERIKQIEFQQEPVSYTTLEQALQAKLENTKRIMDTLNPEARARLTNEAKQDQADSLSI